jgi:phosphatidylglycerophosphate synthase
VRTVRSGPVIGLTGQILLLMALAMNAGLGAAGWLAGLACGAGTCAALSHGLRRSGQATLGPADWVTLARATLAGGVAALVAESFVRPTPVAALVALAAVALVLDAVDGAVARRTATASALGARFDMEVDAFLLLVLSVYAARPAGAWVLAIGGMRYAFAAAPRVLPWMHGALPPRYWRKVVAATQGVALVVAASGVLPRPALFAALAASFALLVESFGRDVAWLWYHRPVAAEPSLTAGIQLPAGRGHQRAIADRRAA